MLQQHAIDSLDIFFSRFNSVEFNKRTVISHIYNTPANVLYIKQGFLRVYRISEHGEELTLTILKPKDFFPLTYGITDLKFTKSYHLETITKLSLWQAPAYKFHKFIADYPEVFTELTRYAFNRFNEALSNMEFLVYGNAYSKVITAIISCAKKFGNIKGDTVIIKIPLTHKDISTLVGITRETTSVEMKKLEKKGYITRIGKYITINNIKKLEDLLLIQGRNNYYNSLST